MLDLRQIPETTATDSLFTEDKHQETKREVLTKTVGWVRKDEKTSENIARTHLYH